MGTKKPSGGLSKSSEGLFLLERVTGIEPATLSLGS